MYPSKFTSVIDGSKLLIDTSANSFWDNAVEFVRLMRLRPSEIAKRIYDEIPREDWPSWVLLVYPRVEVSADRLIDWYAYSSAEESGSVRDWDIPDYLPFFEPDCPDPSLKVVRISSFLRSYIEYRGLGAVNSELVTLTAELIDASDSDFWYEFVSRLPPNVWPNWVKEHCSPKQFTKQNFRGNA